MQFSTLPIGALPEFDARGLLPPFVGMYPERTRCVISPYRVSVEEIRKKLLWSTQRRSLFDKFLDHRAVLKRLGITGRQWIGGSFVTTGEANDIDVVCLFLRPKGQTSDEALRTLVRANPQAFDRATIKQRFACEMYFVDCGLTARTVAEHISYYTSLLSHGRDLAWRGFVELDMD